MKIFSRLSPESSLIYVLFGVAAAIISAIIYWVEPGFFTLVDLNARDSMFKQRGIFATPEAVVIVAVDEKSVNEIGRWPWDRKVIGEMIRAMKPAKVVALDMVFSETQDPVNDAALNDAINYAGNVVMGYFFRNDSTEEPDPLSLEKTERSTIKLFRYLDDNEVPPSRLPFFEFTGIEPNISSLGDGASGYGAYNIFNDPDGLYRSAFLAYRYEGNIYPTLSLEALRRYYGDELVVNSAVYGIDSIAIGGKTIPLDEAGRLDLNFYGPGGSFTTYSAVDILNHKIADEELAGKIIFFGVTETGIYDIRNTPVDPLYPGVEVHATIVGSILDERYLVHDMLVILLDIILILTLPVILSYLISKVTHTYQSLLVFLAMNIALVYGVFYLFSSNDLVVSVIYPVFATGLTYVSLEAYRNIVVEKKSRYIRKAFSTYVSPHLVSEIIKDPDKLKLGGEKRNISILFSDIRGFTTLSEKLEPDVLVGILNEYLNPMTRIVLEEDGTLDKYIGDAIMAIFNAPLEIEDHAGKACSVAIHMIKEMPKLNRHWEENGHNPLAIGVGVHTGEAVVGNMGAELRFDYTAIGDTVNLASRLEGMTKLYGNTIIISDSTQNALNDRFLYRKLDLVRVKGKKKPVGIFGLLDFSSDASPEIVELVEAFAEAHMNYKKGKFRTAINGFNEILKQHPEDGPSKLYISRCNDYVKSPPSSDWDGIYTATSK